MRTSEFERGKRERVKIKSVLWWNQLLDIANWKFKNQADFT
jgi:hypothetical protein